MELERFPKAMPLRDERGACAGGQEMLSARAGVSSSLSELGPGHSPGLRGAPGAPPTPWRGWGARWGRWPAACCPPCWTCPSSVCDTTERDQRIRVSPHPQHSQPLPEPRPPWLPHPNPLGTKGIGSQPTLARQALRCPRGAVPSLGAGRCSAFHCGCGDSDGVGVRSPHVPHRVPVSPMESLWHHICCSVAVANTGAGTGAGTPSRAPSTLLIPRSGSFTASRNR